MEAYLKFNLYLIMFFAVLFGLKLSAEPPRNVPEHLIDQYTLEGKIAVVNWYFDESASSQQPHVYKIPQVDALIRKALSKETYYYGTTDTYLYEALEKYSIYKKHVAVLGSVTPWYESIVLAARGIPLTIDYNRIDSRDRRIKTMTLNEYNRRPRQFDALLSISSFEHDGLGRYGDPIDPFGDIKAMRNAKTMLKPGGLLFLAVPVGPDTLVWNAHRIYGKIRLPLLLEGWEIVDSFGFSPADFDNQALISTQHHQPVFVLRPLP